MRIREADGRPSATTDPDVLRMGALGASEGERGGEGEGEREVPYRKGPSGEPTDDAIALIERVHWEWITLCRWDPMLAPGVRPPFSLEMIDATASALEREQPLGWGLDPALEEIAEDFAAAAGDVHVALGELVCMREAFSRVLIESCPLAERAELSRRLHMIVERTMLTVAQAGARRLSELALTDGLTGLGNRSAFEKDLEREIARAARHDVALAVAVIDLDGLKTLNDAHGHGAGDEALRRVGRAIRACARQEDRGYRIGGDEFVVLFSDTADIDPDVFTDRLRDVGGPPLSVGVASSPPDPVSELVRLADERLYERRATRRR